MRNLALVILCFCITILCWGIYVPVLQWGQAGMSTAPPIPARWRPFVCVGMAYFLIGVIVPILLLKLKGEKGEWTYTGVVWSLAGGVLGALGALGIILAFTFGASPLYVAPLVFGLAPVVNSFLTIYLAGKMREIGPFFLAGLVMVVLGAVTVLFFAPSAHPPAKPAAAAPATATASAAGAPAAATTPSVESRTKAAADSFGRWLLQILSIVMVGVCWGAYGPTLHKGQAAMMNSRLRPLLCVGLAYFAVAVVVPNFVLAQLPEASGYLHSVKGTLLSVLAGSAGAFGALGIIMAFNFGGKPIYVMPLIFGGAPVVATFVSAIGNGLMGQLGAMFIAGLMLVIAGAVMVLVFAPKGHGPTPMPQPVPVTPAPAAEAKTP